MVMTTAGPISSIGEALALCCGTRRRIGAADRFAPQPQHGALEGQTRARAGFVKQACQNGALGLRDAFPDAMGQIRVAQLSEIGVRQGKNRFDLIDGEIVNRRNVTELLHQSWAYKRV